MIFTDYYRFEKKPGGKSKLRMDCTASTKTYDGFERLRNKTGHLFVYVCQNYTEAGERNKSDLALSRNDHITSLSNTNATLPLWYGDFKGTPDALMMVHKGFDKYSDAGVADGSTIEIFIARGFKWNKSNLFAEFADGAFNDEMDELRERSTPEPPKVQEPPEAIDILY